MKRLVLLVITLLFVTTSAFASEYAVVDLQKVLNSCDLGKGARNLMRDEFASYDSEIMLLQNKLKTNKTNLDAMKESEERDNISKKYLQNVEQYKQITQNAQSYLSKVDNDFTKLILEQAFLALQKYNRTFKTSDSETKYVAIFEKVNKDQLDGKQNKKIDISTLNLSNADDITEDIIEYLDNSYKFVDHLNIFNKKIEENKYKIRADF